MEKKMTQVKFTIESGIVAAFKARCASEGVSMAAAARQWMKGPPLAKASMPNIDTRPHRRKTALEITALLESVLQAEQDYRDAIPEAFQSRRESAECACDGLERAIECLENAF